MDNEKKTNKDNNNSSQYMGFFGRSSLGMRPKLTGVLLFVKIVPILIVAVLCFYMIYALANQLLDIAVKDSTAALNARAVENIERLTTDTAKDVADFLYERDSDILYAAKLYNTDMDTLANSLKTFSQSKSKKMIKKGKWELRDVELTDKDGKPYTEKQWMRIDTPTAPEGTGGGESTNPENDDRDGFHYRPEDLLEYEQAYLYDEIAYFQKDGAGNYVEMAKYVAKDDTVNEIYAKKTKGFTDTLNNLSEKNEHGNYKNTFVQAEDYLNEVADLDRGEIYVSDVIGEYVGTNYIGMYNEENVAAVAASREDSTFTPEKQAYAGEENPNGKRFEGIVRWVTPVYSGTVHVGYMSFALNHDHIMELVDHITPMDNRYQELPSAYDGNYAFIWDYNCRSICHPRHHSITGYDAKTGNPQLPWLEESVYQKWLTHEKDKDAGGNLLYDAWDDYVLKNEPIFSEQSRQKKPATDLTYKGLVGLDGRYLNNAPQCTGWMDLTQDGGSGSFYILWSKLYKLTTAGAIPYYTGKYAPSADNGFSRRGFGFVAIGAGMEDFTAAAAITSDTLESTIDSGLNSTIITLVISVISIIIVIVFIALWISNSITRSITDINRGMLRFRSGERQFRFETLRRDEFGTMAKSFDDMADSIDESVNNPLSITDMDKKIIYMNELSLKFCNVSLDEITGTLYSDSSIYPAGSKYCPITALQENREAEVYYSENNDRYFRGVAKYLTDTDGTKKGYMIESRDVTDMVKRQQEIEQQRKILDEVLSASPDLIWYMDTKGQFLTLNPRFASLVGLTPADLVGKKIYEEYDDERFADLIAKDMEAIKQPSPVYSEDILTFADGHTETTESVRIPIVGKDNKTVGLLGFARNVTERVRIEHELREAQIGLEEAVEIANNASQHKGDFLARMSHEIRTPMNAVIGITDIVLKKLAESDPDDERVAEIKGYMGQIDSSSKHLLGLLNDILDITKIEAGKIELADETISMKRMVNTIVSIIKPRCDEKNINLIVDVDEFPNDTFKLDALRLRQVLINILGNAVKFTGDCGVINLQIKLLKRENGKSFVHFAVRDSGIGIPYDAQKTIFEAFEQASGNITRKYGGTGLGLAISQRIVKLFGGEIVLKSEPGEGSEFSFDIYLTETNEAVEEESSHSDVAGRFTGKRILLVDDVDINRMIVRSMLETTGAIIEEANDGQIAVDMFTGSPMFYYDIILMDIKMPNLDGYGASDAIRALKRPDAETIPIIALTANAFKEDIEEALAHKMNTHVSKPIESAVLYSVMIKYLLKE